MEKLKEAVKQAKKNRKWGHEYVELPMRHQENMERGKIEVVVSNVTRYKAFRRAVSLGNTLL